MSQRLLARAPLKEVTILGRVFEVDATHGYMRFDDAYWVAQQWAKMDSATTYLAQHIWSDKYRYVPLRAWDATQFITERVPPNLGRHEVSHGGGI